MAHFFKKKHNILQEIVAIKKNQEVLEAKAKLKKASDEKINETREKFAALRKGKQDLVRMSLKSLALCVCEGVTLCELIRSSFITSSFFSFPGFHKLCVLLLCIILPMFASAIIFQSLKFM